MFSSQSKEQARAAAEIKLVSDKRSGPVIRPIDDEYAAAQRKEVVLPQQRRTRDEPLESDNIPGVHRETLRVEVDVDEVPDDSTRKVELLVPEEEMNTEGSYEALLTLGSRMKGSG